MDVIYTCFLPGKAKEKLESEGKTKHSSFGGEDKVSAQRKEKRTNNFYMSEN